MLPEYEGLKDQEARYRDRHLDLMVNSESLGKLKKRALIISTLRNHLEKKGFMEVETPTLSESAGGAIAVQSIFKSETFSDIP